MPLPRAVRLALGALVGSTFVQADLTTPHDPNDPQVFEWGFTQTVSSTLIACQKMPLVVAPLINNGTPPYYMMAFPYSGKPVVSYIGTNTSNLVWTVTHPGGTQLILGVVDSRGTSGGIDIPLYTVVAGASSCLPPEDTPPRFTISSPNLAMGSTMNTCSAWGLSIQGGVPPYNVTIAATNSPDVTNVTLGLDDKYFSYISRAAPGREMIAAASDSTGRWATGSPVVATNGSTDATCNELSSASSPNATILGTGLSSSSTSTSSPATGPFAHGTVSLSTRSMGLIGGGIALLVVILALVGLCYWRRRRAIWEHKVAQAEASSVSPFVSIGPAPMAFPGTGTTGVLVLPMSPTDSDVSNPVRTSGKSAHMPGSPTQATRELPPPYPQSVLTLQPHSMPHAYANPCLHVHDPHTEYDD